MSKSTGKLADPQWRHQRASAAGRQAQTPEARARGLIATIDAEDPDGWAERIAASLPALTDAEAAAVGRLAAVVDARRRSNVDERTRNR